MSLGIRGANPIWSEFDLSGKIFDDTYYMWVLENQIPYIPATVYHDPDFNTAWTQPIQFLGNGTLPNDIYFESGVVYRLEFRQGDGLNTPTQQDPLIYLVENYVPGSGGSTPVDTVAFASSNQVTNPQFALINFGTPSSPTYTFTGTDPSPIQIGPGWFLDLAGTGTVTLTQVPLTSDTPTPSNAPYALQITLSGWTADSVFLRQRFFQSGVLWANQIVSTAITARVQGLNVAITASLVDSQNATLGQLLSTTVDNVFNEYTDYAKLNPSTDTDIPPAAYIDYVLALPNNVDMYVTSIQLVVQDLPILPTFEQDSINRQIDHTYHSAYPIVPIGTVIDFMGFTTPRHYLPCDGIIAYSRIVYPQLFRTLTLVQNITQITTNTFTVTSAVQIGLGMFIEGAGIPTGTTITVIAGTTITVSAATTSTGTFAATFFAAGQGDGSTTFNTPDLRGFIISGADGTILNINGTTANRLGVKTGVVSHVLVSDDLPPHVHPPLAGAGNFMHATTPSGAPVGTTSFFSVSRATTGANVTANNAVSLVQPTTFAYKYIRYE